MTSGQRSICSWWCSGFDRLNLKQPEMENDKGRDAVVSAFVDFVKHFYFASFSMSF